MSQEDVLAILKELGGSATTAEIRALAKRKYPTRSLYTYIIDRLKRLRKWGDVDFVGEKWVIIKKKKGGV